MISRTLQSLATQSGHGAAKTSRSALSGMFRIAVADGAVPRNPVVDAGARINRSTARAPRAMTVEQTDRLVALFRADERARALDLPDLVDWMLATGCRIGEALATRFEDGADGRPVLDLAAAIWTINATVVRVRGEGLTIQRHTKTRAGLRTVALPGYAVKIASNRRTAAGLLFAAPLAGGLRDPSNVSGDLRALLDSFECEDCNEVGVQLDRHGAVRVGPNGRPVRCDRGPWTWVTSHTFRKSVATRLDESGFTPRQVADQLGHANPSMTQDVYFGRSVVNIAVATALDRS